MTLANLSNMRTESMDRLFKLSCDLHRDNCYLFEIMSTA